MVNERDLAADMKRYEEHLRETVASFNARAEDKELPVRMSADKAIGALRLGHDLARARAFGSRKDDNGIVHQTQLATAVDCISELLTSEKPCGHVVGAMQSGKTTTSLALQWAGPILYLLTGHKVYPFYVIGNQIGHQDQTEAELGFFLSYYKNIEITLVPGTKVPKAMADALFKSSPTLATYRDHILVNRENVFSVPKLELIHRRVGGEQSVKRIAALCKKAVNDGFRPLMVIDEPQFGASDHFVEDAEGKPQRRKCVLAQIFDEIEKELGSVPGDHWFVGLSATPFELNDLERVWEVRQSLTEEYSGYNYFNGRPICEGVDIKPPETVALSELADSLKIPFLARISMSAYGKAKSFKQHAKKIGYDKSHVEYRREVEKSLRKAIYTLVQKYEPLQKKDPVGFCIRAFNDNTKTEELLAGLALDQNRIEIVRFFGTEMSGASVKRAVAGRQRPELPYLIMVTNRARMADAFPIQVRFFMDMAQKASDLNALLQGLLGRACGYGKKSTVVLSDENTGIVRAYVATKGGYVHQPSRHTVTIGGYRRGAPTGMLKLKDDTDDSVVQAFFKAINTDVVGTQIPAGSSKISPTRAKGGEKYRTGPILLIAEKLRLFEHIEEPGVRAVIFPQIPSGFHVAKRGEKIRHSRDGRMLGYTTDSRGNCRYTFRDAGREEGAKGGATGRAKGLRDSGQHIEPTIYVEKYDEKTGKVIADKGRTLRKPGKWRAHTVTFPLLEPVREIKVADAALPKTISVFNDLATDEEKSVIIQAEKDKAARKKKF